MFWWRILIFSKHVVKRLAFRLNKLQDIQDATWWFVSMMKWYIHNVCGLLESPAVNNSREMKSVRTESICYQGQEARKRSEFSFRAIYVRWLVTWLRESITQTQMRRATGWLVISTYLISLFTNHNIFSVAAFVYVSYFRSKTFLFCVNIPPSEPWIEQTQKQTLIFISATLIGRQFKWLDHVKFFIRARAKFFVSWRIIALRRDVEWWKFNWKWFLSQLFSLRK